MERRGGESDLVDAHERFYHEVDAVGTRHVAWLKFGRSAWDQEIE